MPLPRPRRFTSFCLQDLYARIKSDVINLSPTVISVLIGVNDTWHEFGSQNGVAVPK